MGASRKLQGEIDRVLKKVQEGVDVFDSIWNKVYDTDNANQKEKFEADLKKEIKKLQRYRDQIKTWIQSSEIKDKKVSASYEQALMDARKLIEREMERFKICEKETKTKAFSKEGLGLQPKTDPKEKAKSETRDWLNNVVSELENQIDSFEAEMEGLTVKKGKTRPPRLTHLETSIVRHKAHIMKLELILRLLDNDELSPEQVNDVKDFLDDYVERNQEDFDEFSDVDELYSTLPLDKVESLEDLVTIGPPSIVKASVTSSVQLGVSTQEEETASASAVQDSVNSSEVAPKTPTPKASAVISSAPVTPVAAQSTPVTPSALSPSSMSNSGKEEDISSFPSRKSTPAPPPVESSLKGVSKGQAATTSAPISTGSSISSNGSSLGVMISPGSEIAKRNILGAESSGTVQQQQQQQTLVSPLGSNRLSVPQVSKISDGIASAADETGVGIGVGVGGSMGSTRVFSPSVVVPGIQWRPGSSFQNQNEVGQFRGRTEIAPDQREKFLQRFQQVQQQQGQTNLLNMPPIGGGANHKQFSSTQQQNPLLQQFTSQSSSITPQIGLGIGLPSPGVSSASLQQQQHQASNQQMLISPGSRDSEAGNGKSDDLQQQQAQSEDSSSVEAASKNLTNEDEMKSSYGVDSPNAVSEAAAAASQLGRDVDLSTGQPLQPNQPSASLGVIGRRSVADLGAIGDNFSASAVNSGGMHDQLYNLQMLESAFYKLPQPKDSERPKSYTPRHPAATPQSYPQVQAPIVNNPAFWERLGSDNFGTDTLFFSFYYQPNTYQQYLAAKELKKQSWRYHRKYNTWFQRHEEPKVATDDFEQGTYVYFDFHIANDEQHGWCQRIKTEFTFEYNYLEDELIV